MNNNSRGSSNPAVEAISRILDHVETRRKKKLDQWTARYTLADGVKIFGVRWALLMKEHYPRVPLTPISPKRDVPRIKRNIVTPLRGANIMVADFVRFVFDNWSLIRKSKQFRNFKTYPDYPALPWVLKFSDLYVSTFVDYLNLNDTIFEEPEQLRKIAVQMDKQESLSKVVRVARDELRKKEAEIAKLRAENQSLQSTGKRGIPRVRTAKPTKQLPDWE